MHLVPGARRKIWRGAVLLLLPLAACGASGGGSAAPPIGTSTKATSTSTADGLDRDALRTSVEAGFRDTSLETTSDELDCYTDSLIDEVGLERLWSLGVPGVDPLSGVVLSGMSTNIDDAAAYFTPFFECLDTDDIVRESVTDQPDAVQDCVVDAVTADREVRVIYMLGTKTGSEPSPEIEQMTAPLIERAWDIQAECVRDN